jgi:hypothetical protein
MLAPQFTAGVKELKVVWSVKRTAERFQIPVNLSAVRFTDFVWNARQPLR